MAPGFEPRKVIWDAQKVERVWDFHGNNPAFDASRFSAHSSSEFGNWAFSRIKPVESTNVDIGCGAILHPKQHVRASSAHSLSNFLESKGFIIDARICINRLDHRGGFFIRRMKSLYRKFSRANYKPQLGIVATLKQPIA